MKLGKAKNKTEKNNNKKQAKFVFIFN